MCNAVPSPSLRPLSYIGTLIAQCTAALAPKLQTTSPCPQDRGKELHTLFAFLRTYILH